MKEFYPLPERENNRCFACSSTNLHGLQMRFFSNGEMLISDLSVPEHLCGWRNLVHGGVISTILDEVMGWSAVYLLRRFSLTKSITIEFLKPLKVGSRLRAEGRVKKLVSEREAEVEGKIFNEEGTLCARGTGFFATFTPEIAKRLGIIDENLVDELEKIFQA